MIKCISVLDNNLPQAKLPNKLAAQQLQLQDLLYRFQMEDQATAANPDRPSHLPADRLELLSSCQYVSDFWLSTSGVSFSRQRLASLKTAGLAGVVLRLDHFDPEKHNTLLRYKHSYGWVLKVADMARSLNLLLCLRLCPSKNFINPDNLFAYTRLAKKIGVTLIQILDPVTKGTSISPSTIGFDTMMILDDFTEMLNYQQDFINWPVMSYKLALEHCPDNKTHQKKHALFVDSSGKIHQTHY